MGILLSAYGYQSSPARQPCSPASEGHAFLRFHLSAIGLGPAGNFLQLEAGGCIPVGDIRLGLQPGAAEEGGTDLVTADNLHVTLHITLKAIFALTIAVDIEGGAIHGMDRQLAFGYITLDFPLHVLQADELGGLGQGD